MKSSRNKKDRKKIMATILVVIIVLALLLGLAAPFFAAEPNNIHINAKIGFEQKYRIGSNTPFLYF